MNEMITVVYGCRFDEGTATPPVDWYPMIPLPPGCVPLVPSVPVPDPRDGEIARLKSENKALRRRVNKLRRALRNRREVHA